ncbi:Nramp family divalent metal transporter [candidate division KSB1 bacterium]|nr:Nramp family divalent metal transporter [candidate division KSB1 bacterium]
MKIRNLFKVIGPAFIMASVVLGPGSITTSTKIGFAYGYQLMWIIVLAAVAMGMYVFIAARFGVSHEKTILQAIADAYGRWFAGLIGISCFLMASSFQFGNNLGVATAMQTLTGIPEPVWPVVFTSSAIILVFFARNLYKILEKLMMVMVMTMIAAFFINLFFTKPDLVETVKGFVPVIPKGSYNEMAALVATTFCLHVALYQSYLVRDKGWKLENLKGSIGDTIAGIVMLGGISMLIIMTSASTQATALRLDPTNILTVNTAGDMAIQLQKLFGPFAKTIFCIGLWAAAFSSLTVNAVIGGGLMADGLGLGRSMDDRWPKIFSIFGMLVGMIIAVFFKGNIVQALVFAQAASLFAVPAVAIGLFMIANNRKVMGDLTNSWKQNIIAVFGLLLILAMVWRMYHYVISNI